MFTQTAHPLPRPALALALACLVALCLIQSAQASAQFNYFIVETYPTVVNLKWSTAREVDVLGFDAQYKLANTADDAYQSIAMVPAKGGADAGALYELPVLGVTPGVAYCFRLVVVTGSGAAGEILDRCGYGPGVTPTPGPTPMFTPGSTPPPAPTAGSPAQPTPKPKPVPVPEPVTLVLYGLGLAGLGAGGAETGEGVRRRCPTIRSDRRTLCARPGSSPI